MEEIINEDIWTSYGNSNTFWYVENEKGKRVWQGYSRGEAMYLVAQHGYMAFSSLGRAKFEKVKGGVMYQRWIQGRWVDKRLETMAGLLFIGEKKAEAEGLPP